MRIIGKVVGLMPLQTGQGKNGEWKKQDIILETEERYPKKICISFFNEKIIDENMKFGNLLIIDVDIESREYNNKWYTNVFANYSQLFIHDKYNQQQDIHKNNINNNLQDVSSADIPNITEDLPF